MGLPKGGVCASSHIVRSDFPDLKNIMAIRLYISALTLVFLFAVLANRGLGILEGVVITCAVLYLILDARSELQELKSELSMLKDLEQEVSKLLSLHS